MIKNLKKIFALALCALTLVVTPLAVNADDSVEQHPQPRATYRYPSQVISGTVYLGGGTLSNSTTFSSAYNPWFSATQEAAVSGQPCGVIYQIRSSSGAIIDAKQLSNKQVGYSVKFTHSGTIKASLKNVYNTTVKQRVSGVFNY